MPNENDSEDLAPNFHGAYREPDEGRKHPNEEISQPDENFKDTNFHRFDYEVDSYGNVFSSGDIDKITEESKRISQELAKKHNNSEE